MASVDEIAEQHKKDGNVLNKKEQKIIDEKHKNINKIIDPKFIFEKKPKPNKDIKKNKLRQPNIENKKELKPIKEYEY